MISLFIYQMLATFGIVLCRLFQNLNSINKRYALMLPTTILIAISEVIVIKMVANGELETLPLIISMSLGGWLGCVLATYFNSLLGKGNK